MRIIILALIMVAFFAQAPGTFALAANGCCAKDACKCAGGTCCIKGVCKCSKEACCAGGICKCGPAGCVDCKCS